MLTLAELQLKNRERQKEWDPGDDITIEYRGNELAGEIGELCNLLKKVARARLGLRGSRASEEDIMKEIGDGIICLTLICNHLDMSLEECVFQAFNQTSEKYGLNTRL